MPSDDGVRRGVRCHRSSAHPSMHQHWDHLAEAVKIVVWLVPHTGHPNAAVTQKATYALCSQCHLQSITHHQQGKHALLVSSIPK